MYTLYEHAVVIVRDMWARVIDGSDKHIDNKNSFAI